MIRGVLTYNTILSSSPLYVDIPSSPFAVQQNHVHGRLHRLIVLVPRLRSMLTGTFQHC